MNFNQPGWLAKYQFHIEAKLVLYLFSKIFQAGDNVMRPFGFHVPQVALYSCEMEMRENLHSQCTEKLKPRRAGIWTECLTPTSVFHALWIFCKALSRLEEMQLLLYYIHYSVHEHPFQFRCFRSYLWVFMGRSPELDFTLSTYDVSGRVRTFAVA